MAKRGADEQEPDIRPVPWGNPAIDGAADGHPHTHTCESGGRPVKEQRLTLEGLRRFPGGPGAGDRQRTATTADTSAETIVAGRSDRRRAE
jgi:hypothetical protein